MKGVFAFPVVYSAQGLEDGWAESLTYSARRDTTPELTGMLRQVGLSLTAIHSGFDGSEFDIHSKRLIVVARKPYCAVMCYPYSASAYGER
jgi:hypothetical protein